MRKLFYKFLIALTKNLGPWVFTLFAWPIATGFFLFSPLKVAVGVRFYRVLFPGKNIFYYIWCTWRQYHNFTHVFMDRFMIMDSEGITHTSEGWEHLKEAVEYVSHGKLGDSRTFIKPETVWNAPFALHGDKG